MLSAYGVSFHSLMQSMVAQRDSDSTRRDAQLEALKQQNRLLKDQIASEQLKL